MYQNHSRVRRNRGGVDSPVGSNFVVPSGSGAGSYSVDDFQRHGGGRSRNAVATGSASSTTRVVITQKMEDEMLALNSEYLRTQDVGFRCIIEKASQAAIYSYNLAEGEGWSDAKAAGCLMLYERNISPRLGFIILNRLAVPNWKHFFTPSQVEIQIQGKYLLFKNGHDIFCLWFYEDKDPEKFGEIMRGVGCKLAEDY